MPFTICTKKHRTECDRLCTDKILRETLTDLDINEKFIVVSDMMTWYVKQMGKTRMVVMCFDEYPGYAILIDNLLISISSISHSESDRYRTEISELADKFTTEKATNLIDRLDDRLSQIICRVRSVGADTEPISNVKRSLC